MNDGNQQLFEAASSGNMAATSAAIDAGAEVNAKNISQQSPLHLAAGSGRTNIARFLMDNGAAESCRLIHRAAVQQFHQRH